MYIFIMLDVKIRLCWLLEINFPMNVGFSLIKHNAWIHKFEYIKQHNGTELWILQRFWYTLVTLPTI